MSYTIESKHCARMIAQALHHALEWGDKCAERDGENWFVTDEGALSILADLRAECDLTKNRIAEELKP